MVDGTSNTDPAQVAGNFSAWMAQMQGAIQGEHGSDVPCGSCTACCTSSQFVHIEPDEADALAHIPTELLFPAPGRPRGHVLLGYDERGHCPMLVGGQCSIYQHRPRTCRTYDCRIFPATGVEIHDPAKVEIGRQARRWRFDFPTEDDRTQQRAVRAAVSFLRQPADDVAPISETQLAVQAIEIHARFVADGAITADPIGSSRPLDQA